MSKRVICIDDNSVDSLMVQDALSCDDYVVTHSLEESMKYINEDCEFYFYNIENLSKSGDEFDPIEAGMNYMILHFAHNSPIFFKTSSMFNSHNLKNYVNS